MKMSSSTVGFTWALLLVGVLSVACGGTFEDDGGSSGGAGSATGGASADGGSTTGTGGDSPVCCQAAATCAEGETELQVADDCPIEAECYSASICCDTTWCMKPQAPCKAVPTCAESETEVQECPSDSACVQRALCGTVITCDVGLVICDLGPQPNRHYIAGPAIECEGIDFACPEHTLGFSDHCGCGCEQPDSCPEVIDCEPGGEMDPLCDSNECPYSTRAL